MDKSKWEYKKLGELGEIITGGTPPTKDPRNYSSDDYCFVKPSDLTDEKVMMLDDSEFHVSAYAYSNSRKLPKGSVLVCCIGSIGKLGILNVDATCNQQINAIIPKEGFASRYLAYTLLASKHNLLNIANAPVVPIINKSQFSNIKIKVCPPQDQQRIVAELDCLNEMIALKQEQLNEFDKLAQSIFYDMFGDPVTDEKGWDVIELGDKCEVTSFKRVLIEDVVDSGVPFIRGTELMALSKATKGEKIEFTLFITPEHYEQVKAISGVPAVGDLLIPSINSEGNIWILDTDEPRYYKDGRVLWVHVNHDAYTSEALKFIMHILLKKTYSVMATGATFAELKLFVLRELKTILPPLALQQQFAEKIQAIEAQKELVKKSIAETQHLLDSRMDLYFD